VVAIYMQERLRLVCIFLCLFCFGCTARSGESGVVLLLSRDLDFVLE